MKRLCVVFAMVILYGVAQAEVSRMTITISGYNKPETLTNFPLLVVLSNNVAGSGFNYNDFLSQNGHDLRFYDSNNTELNYEIERWWSPDEPVTGATQLAGCLLWLDAGAGVLTNASGGVTNWQDQSGNGYDALEYSGRTVPSVLSAELNGQPVLDFNGVQDQLANMNWNPSCTGFTFFIVHKVDSSETVNSIGFAQAPTGGRDYNSADGFCQIAYVGPGKNYFTHNSGKNIDYYPGSATTPYSVVALAINEGNSGMADGYRNGDHTALHPTWKGNLSPGVYVIGNRIWDGAPHSADMNSEISVAEIIIYGRRLDFMELDRVGAYLAQKYALTTTYGRADESTVWVQVPKVETSNTFITAKWGNASTTNQQTYTTNGATWSNGYAGVWHMAEFDKTSAAEDSAGADRDGAASASFESSIGKIAGSRVVASAGYFSVPSGEIDLVNQCFTVSCWTKLAGFDDNRYHAGQGINVLRQGLHLGLVSTEKFQFALWGDDVITADTYGADVSQWHYWVTTFETTGKTMIIYRDGVEVARDTAGGNYVGSGVFNIGKALPLHTSGFVGNVDEMRVSDSMARSTNWIWASWMNQASNTTFCSYGQVLKSGGTVFVLR